MKERDWEILRVLYEKRSMTKAAEALYMTQSALTKRIKAMEDEWGTEIVKRSSKGVNFTEDGRYLVQKATIISDFLEEMRDHLAESGAAKPGLKLGVPNSFARLHMAKLLREYTDRYDEIQVRTVSNSSDVIIQQLVDGTVDAGVICGDYPFLGDKVCLFDEELFVVAPKGTRLDDLERVPLIESYYNPMVKLIIDQWWKIQFGSMPHEAQQVPYSDIAIEMVERGLGICFLFGADWRVDSDKVQTIPIYDKYEKPISRRVWLMWSERCYKSPEIIRFIEFVQDYYCVSAREKG